MTRVRSDIATLGAGWNPTILWYARAVAALSQRPPNDRTGWRYLGAIHGFNEAGWIDAGIISTGDPLPPGPELERMWNQCQHQGWYFLPWHRGYVAAFEAIVASTVADLGGPADWALPYWNYLNASDPQARHIPQPFLDPTLPDGSANPLSAPPRGGTQVLGPTPWFPRDITLNAMGVPRFTSAPGTLGFGGGATGFNQFGGRTGAMEADPHNNVHVMIGGVGPTAGYMSNPDYAGLDPIFWLHHCNVDRLWAAWLTQPGNIQEAGAAWRNGPFPRRFEMPDSDGNLAIFTPGQTLPGGPLAPTYDSLTSGTGATALPASVDDEQAEESDMPATLSSEPPPAATLVGANAGVVTVGEGASATSVQLAPEQADIAGDPVEQRVFLNLENIRGASPSGVLNVSVSMPAAGAVPASAPTYVDSVALFGLAKASADDGAMGGNGISVAIDITDLATELAQAAGSALEGLEVHIEQPGGSADQPITVERVSVYKQPVG